MPNSELWTCSHHCHFTVVFLLDVPIYLTLNAQQRLLTTQRNLLHDYDSGSVSSESINSARLLASGIDGSCELLAEEESNIGGARIEDVQQK